MPRKTRNQCSCGHSFLPATERHRRKCPRCGSARVPRARAKHLAALKLPRAVFVEANDGYDGCWVCRDLGETRPGRVVRDHEHSGAGQPRGLLCDWHNRLLGPRYTPELVAAYARYLNRQAA